MKRVEVGPRGGASTDADADRISEWVPKEPQNDFECSTELELELIKPHMAQKPVLRGEVGCACVAREVSVERGGMGERGCARRLGGWVWV